MYAIAYMYNMMMMSDVTTEIILLNNRTKRTNIFRIMIRNAHIMFTILRVGTTIIEI